MNVMFSLEPTKTKIKATPLYLSDEEVIFWPYIVSILEMFTKLVSAKTQQEFQDKYITQLARLKSTVTQKSILSAFTICKNIFIFFASHIFLTFSHF